MSIQTVGIVAKPKRADVARAALDLTEWLEHRGKRVLVDPETAGRIGRSSQALASDSIGDQVDLVVVIGGDGTLLAAARLLGGRAIPVLPVNYGSLGFLTKVPVADLYAALDRTLAGQFVTERRMMLNCALYREGRCMVRYQALNDVVINKGALARIIEIEATVNGEYVSTFRSDGLIVATPTGSTAYSLSAGGPIVFPTMEAMLMTPICSHTLTNRPILLPGDVTVDVIVKSTRLEDVYLTVDGQIGIPMKPEDRVTLCKSEGAVALVAPADNSYFRLLREKLKWG